MSQKSSFLQTVRRNGKPRLWL